jgi:hypothetical protein
MMSLGDDIHPLEPLNKLCSALDGWAKQTAIETGQPIEEIDEARAAAVIRILAEALMRYERHSYSTDGSLGPAVAQRALSWACDLATPPPAKASDEPPDMSG